MSTSNKKWDLDEIDRRIFEGGLRITEIYFNKELDSMIVLLNNHKVLQRRISTFPRLAKASLNELQNYEISRTGIHWPALDEDLSLRGFLKEEMLEIIS